MKVLDAVTLGALLALAQSHSASAAPGPSDGPGTSNGTGTVLAPDRDPAAIIGGEVTASDGFVNVVAVVAGNALCTGTLIAKNLVITAAHCLVDVGPDTPVVVFYGNKIVQQHGVPAVSFGAHPDFCPTCDEDIHDYGYVVTRDDFLPPYAAPIMTQAVWDETMAVGEAVTLVGFGNDPDVTGPDALGVKRQVTTTISRFSSEGLEFFAGGDQHDSCEGDSGGPAFVTLPDGSVVLAGITSRGSSPCGKGGYYGAPYPALCWIREQTGIEVLNGDCSTCDCIDTAPEPVKDSNCNVAPTPPPAPWALGLLLLVAVRRRRSS